MRNLSSRSLPLLISCTLASCTPVVPAPAPGPRVEPSALAALHDRYRVVGLEERDFTHAGFWAAVGARVEDSPALERRLVGLSVEGRPIYGVRFGAGDTRVLLWSQMHGDEPTATMALADLFALLSSSTHPLVQRLESELTVVFVPMLNPDGAERFQRRNVMGIDINRDARALVTPEGRALKSVQETFRPHFGFNLHDQNPRTRVGRSSDLAAIALLAPPYDEARSLNEVRTRATHVAAAVREAVEPFVGGHVTRYDDTFNPRAFGDLMQQWGVSTVLIESGGWREDPEKQFLRRVNFVALLSVLDAIATGTYLDADPHRYRALPFNGRPVDDLLVLGGTVVAPGLEPYAADLAINYEWPLRREEARIVDVGDLREYEARDTLDVSGLFVHLRAGERPGYVAPDDTPATFEIRRGADPDSPLVWRVQDGVPLPVSEEP